MPNRKIAKQEENPPAILEYGAVSFRKSPLPPPGDLEKYEKLFPGATKSLFENFLKQSEHRMELEKAVLQKDNKRADRGQVFAFIISMTVIISGIGLILFDKPIVGLSAVIGALATLSGSFFGGLFSRRKEREKKRNALEDKM
jgi:uncharacterized membrane protein